MPRAGCYIVAHTNLSIDLLEDNRNIPQFSPPVTSGLDALRSCSPGSHRKGSQQGHGCGTEPPAKDMRSDGEWDLQAQPASRASTPTHWCWLEPCKTRHGSFLTFSLIKQHPNRERDKHIHAQQQTTGLLRTQSYKLRVTSKVNLWAFALVRASRCIPMPSLRCAMSFGTV